MSKDYYFAEPIELEEFKRQMTANGVVCGDLDPIDEPKPEKWRRSFALTGDGKNYVKAWTVVGATHVDHLTRYGSNNPAKILAVLRDLGHPVDLDSDL